MEKREFRIAHHGRNTDCSFYEPEGTKKYPVVIFSHGYNGHKSDFDISASYLAENGTGALCLTFSGGSTRDESGFATTDMTLFTEEEDLLAALDAVRGMERADTEQIYLFGASQGGLVSAMAAEDRKEDIAGLILLYPALCIADDWRRRYPEEAEIPETTELWDMKMGREFFLAIRDFHVFDRIGGFDKNVLIMHGTEDEIVPAAYSRKAAKLYPSARLEEFAGEPHGFSENGNRRMEAMLLYFVHECFAARTETEPQE